MTNDVHGKSSVRPPEAVKMQSQRAVRQDRRSLPPTSARIQSLARMDAILHAIAAAPDSTAKLTEIAAAANLHKSTAFSLLESLSGLGYVARSKTSGYTLGPRLFEMAKQAERRLDVIPLARPVMYELVRQSRESVTLAIPASLDAIVVSTIEGTFGVRGARWEGRRVPYHASAVGKAMLAFMPADVQESILGELRLERHTRRTIIRRDALDAELSQIRELGFAVCLQEEEDGSNAVAAPILDNMGEVAGAVALWGPASRLTRSHLIAFGSRIAKACGELRQ